MSRKLKKGKKMDLGEFYSAVGAPVNQNSLPEAPRPKEEREEMLRLKRERQNRSFGIGPDRDEEEGPSRAESSDMWRRSGPVGPAAGPGRDRRFGADPREVDGADNWRSSRPVRAAAPRAEPDGDWRSHSVRYPTSDRERPREERFGRADDVDQWRRRDAAPARRTFDDRGDRGDRGDRDGAPRMTREFSNNWRDNRVSPSARQPARAPGYRPLALKRPSRSQARDEENQKPAEANKADPPKEVEKKAEPAVEKPKPKPIKSKKLDPNVKLDPFGGIKPKEAPVKLEPIKVSKMQPRKKVDPFGAAKPARAEVPARAAPTQAAPEEPETKDEKDESTPVVLNQGVPPLTMAVRERQPVTFDDLKSGLKDLELTDDLCARLGFTVGSSIVEEKFSLQDAATELKASCPDTSGKVMTSALETVVSLKDEGFLVKLVKDSGVDITSVISSFTKDLLCIKPGPDPVKAVEDAVAKNADCNELLKTIQDNTDEKTDMFILTSAVSDYVFSKVFEEKKKASFDTLDAYTPALKIVTPSPEAELVVIVAAHVAWFNGGSGKDLIKEVFIKLHASGIVSPGAFLAWKDDKASKKAKGKQKALIKCLKFLNEMAEAVKEAERKANPQPEESDEDYDDDDDMPEHLRNDEYM